MAESRSLTPDEIDEIIEQLGGIEAIEQMNDTFDKVVKYFYANERSLIEEHPYKWVAVTTDRVVAVGDSMESVFEEAWRKGFFNPNLFVQFLDPDPPALFL